MSKMYANDKPDDWHNGCGVVPEQDDNFCYECYLLTYDQLEQLKREYFDAGRLKVGHQSQMDWKHKTFEDFKKENHD